MRFAKQSKILAALALSTLFAAGAQAQQSNDAFKPLNSKVGVEYVGIDSVSEGSMVDATQGVRLNASFQKDVAGIKDLYASVEVLAMSGSDSQTTSWGWMTMKSDYKLDHNSFEMRLGKAMPIHDSSVQVTPYLMGGRGDATYTDKGAWTTNGMKLKHSYVGVGTMLQKAVGPNLWLTGDLNLAKALSTTVTTSATNPFMGWQQDIDHNWHASASLGLTYFVDKNFSLNAHYKFMHTDYTKNGEAKEEQRHRVGLGLAYHF